MKITVLLFGQLAEITGKQSIGLENVPDTESLLAEMNRRYPAFQQARYVVAVNQRLISGNKDLADQNVVALLPPFSGG